MTSTRSVSSDWMGTGVRSLGSVPVSSHSALLRQMAPGKARDAGNGRSLAKFRNAAWRHLPRNPSGRACFCAMRRFSSLIWNDQTSLLAPCLAQKQAPARTRTKREQTLDAGYFGRHPWCRASPGRHPRDARVARYAARLPAAFFLFQAGGPRGTGPLPRQVEISFQSTILLTAGRVLNEVAGRFRHHHKN